MALEELLVSLSFRAQGEELGFGAAKGLRPAFPQRGVHCAFGTMIPCDSYGFLSSHQNLFLSFDVLSVYDKRGHSVLRWDGIYPERLTASKESPTIFEESSGKSSLLTQSARFLTKQTIWAGGLDSRDNSSGRKIPHNFVMFRLYNASSFHFHFSGRRRHLLTGQSGHTRQVLALEQLQAGSAASGNVAELVLDLVVGSNGSGVTTTNDDSLAGLGSLERSVHGLLGAVGELLHLEDAGRAVPQDGLGLVNGGLVELDGFFAAVEAHPAFGNAVLVGGGRGVGGGAESVGGDVVAGKDELDVVLLGLLDETGDLGGTVLVEERVTNADALEGLFEGEGHAAADDEHVDLVEEVVDQLDLVADLGTTKDGEEGTLGRLEGLGEVVELLLHEEAGGLLGEVDADHGAVGAVGSAEGVVDEDVAEGSEALAELLNISLVGLDLLSLGVLAAALLLGVEAQVLEEHDTAVGGLVDGLLGGLANAVVGEGDLLAAEELLELGDDGLERVLGVGLAVGAAEVGHQDDGFGAIVNGVLDGGDGAGDALVVGDLGVGLLVEGHVEVNL